MSPSPGLPAIDPRPYFAALTAAYALPNPGFVPLDVIMGNDINGPTPQGIVVQDVDCVRVAFHGTFDWEELLEDVAAMPAKTSVGNMSSGTADSFNSLTLASGRDPAIFAGAKVTGHSRGADEAAAWAARFLSPEYVLFAYPRLCGTQILAQLSMLKGLIFNLSHDPVAGLVTGWPSAQNIFTVRPSSSSLDILFYHKWMTYLSSLNALYSAPIQ